MSNNEELVFDRDTSQPEAKMKVKKKGGKHKSKKKKEQPENVENESNKTPENISVNEAQDFEVGDEKTSKKNEAEKPPEAEDYEIGEEINPIEGKTEENANKNISDLEADNKLDDNKSNLSKNKEKSMKDLKASEKDKDSQADKKSTKSSHKGPVLVQSVDSIALNINNKKEEEPKKIEQDEEKEDPNELNHTQTNIKEGYKLRILGYKQKIADLENELLEERNTSTKSKGTDDSSALAEKLRQEIREKDKKIEEVINESSKQRKELEKLSNEVDKKLLQMNYKKITTKIKNNRSNQSPKSVENLLQSKDIQISNADKLRKILKKDNALLKSRFEMSKNVNEKLQLVDKSNENNASITALEREILELKMKFKEHLGCQKRITKKIQSVEQTKSDVNQMKMQINLFQNQIDNLKKQIERNNQKKENYINKKEKEVKRSPSRKSPERTKEDPFKIMEDKIKRLKYGSEIKGGFTETERKYIIAAFDYNTEECGKFYEKVSIILGYQKSKSEANDKKTQSYGNKNKELEEQINFHEYKLQESESNCTLSNCEINDLTKEQEVYDQKINELREKLYSLQNTYEKKEEEFNTYDKDLFELRKLIRNGKVNNVDEDINNYIMKVKMQ
ncbi:MAG: hypothetical protein MJ252_20410, partial [archaeon]|nr:hypothetical protein [archaeon]